MSTPLIFKTLEIRNFLSFGNALQTIYLNEQGTVTITGENLDKGGSNGAGKTTIINALCYALYNKAFDAITLQKLINTTNALKNTQMEVRLTFDKGTDEYEIYRARGEDYRIEVKKNGEDITPGKGVFETDDMIEEIIGISYELFTKTIIFSGNSPAFLQLPIHQQRTQIEELFNITMLSEKAKLLKEKIREVESDIKIAEAVVKQQEVAVQLHEKHVKEAEVRITRWDVNRAEQIVEINETLAKVSAINFEEEQHNHDKKSEYAHALQLLKAKLQPAKNDFRSSERKVEDMMKEQVHLQDANCPYCKQAFANSAEKLAELSTKIESEGEHLLSAESIVRNLEDSIFEAEQEFNKYKRLIKHVDLKELTDARTNSEILKQRVVELEGATNPHTEAFEKLLAEGCPEVDNTKADKLKKKLHHQQFLLKLLTDKNSFIRRRIINKTIPFLNNRLNFYTSFMDLPHVVKFDADMSCTVAEFGRELDFGNLSAGEKKRVNTAMAMAFRDVLHHLHARTNLLFIDELEGGLDQQGFDAIVKILKDKSRDENMSVFVISHHPAIQGRLDRDLRIRKENGFSSVIFN